MKVKNKRKGSQTKTLALLAMLALIIFSWVGLFRYHDDTPERFQACIIKAEEFEKNKQYKYAIDSYKEALSYNKTKRDIYWKLVQNYRALHRNQEAIEQCKYIIENFEDNYDAYLEVIHYYVEEEQYVNAITVIMEAREQYKKDQVLKDLWLQCRGSYSLTGLDFLQVSEIKDGQIKVQSVEGLWGVADIWGEGYRLETNYQDCSIFTQVTEKEKLAAIQTDNEVYFVDVNGYRCVVAREPLHTIDIFSEGKAAVSKNLKYGYCELKEDRMMLVERTKLEYDGATAFYQGLAAVKKGNLWAIIDKDMKEITGFEFEEVVVDDFNICSNQGVIFVRKKGAGKYSLIDEEGHFICEDAFEQVKAFPEKGYGAVCKSGNWGFIDSSGGEKTKFIYENAGSMTNGYAPVCINGSWGYIDEKEEQYVACEFQEAKSIDERGCAIVKKENQWMLLHFYLYEVQNKE